MRSHRISGRADSRSKCNGCYLRPVLHEVEGAFGEEEFCGCFPSQGFSGPDVEPPCDIVELFLREQRQVGALGQVLAQQAVGVFADAALPGSVRMGEVDVDSGVPGQGLVVSHLRSLVVGQGAAQLAVEAVEDLGEGLCGQVGPAAVQLDQGDEQGSAFDQRADLRAVVLADDQIALPVARDQAQLDFHRPLVDQDHVRNKAA